ncbi:hypothetical protein DFP72DRAFT_1059543 [Ephemerocybe angulata]|uniref:Uncharacterized protein n=1 Tax=Ephemerocybe angulata TaxID=980116 RepID=A0A8H6IHT6_9AGAR|nr:hypothetical protein DFP72DRAFT_1059543 [Tulosesus angulatus]
MQSSRGDKRKRRKSTGDDKRIRRRARASSNSKKKALDGKVIEVIEDHSKLENDKEVERNDNQEWVDEEPLAPAPAVPHTPPQKQRQFLFSDILQAISPPPSETPQPAQPLKALDFLNFAMTPPTPSPPRPYGPTQIPLDGPAFSTVGAVGRFNDRFAETMDEAYNKRAMIMGGAITAGANFQAPGEVAGGTSSATALGPAFSQDKGKRPMRGSGEVSGGPSGDVSGGASVPSGEASVGVSGSSGGESRGAAGSSGEALGSAAGAGNTSGGASGSGQDHLGGADTFKGRVWDFHSLENISLSLGFLEVHRSDLIWFRNMCIEQHSRSVRTQHALHKALHNICRARYVHARVSDLQEEPVGRLGDTGEPDD